MPAVEVVVSCVEKGTVKTFRDCDCIRHLLYSYCHAVTVVASVTYCNFTVITVT